ncbi:hypothetical protein [Edaphovirga cremea]|uniref:hypothetical protein n=1 Tax=Edaphovirga cremea TaxID=2267246 RepID=UPI0039897FCB
MKCCIVGIRKPVGSLTHGNGISSIWFPSQASLVAVLLDNNPRQLRLFHEIKSNSLIQPVEHSSRRVLNLSYTLRLMTDYGLVSLQLNVRKFHQRIGAEISRSHTHRYFERLVKEGKLYQEGKVMVHPIVFK